MLSCVGSKQPHEGADMSKAIDAIRSVAHIFTADWIRSGGAAKQTTSREPVCIIEVLPTR